MSLRVRHLLLLWLLGFTLLSCAESKHQLELRGHLAAGQSESPTPDEPFATTAGSNTLSETTPSRDAVSSSWLNMVGSIVSTMIEALTSARTGRTYPGYWDYNQTYQSSFTPPSPNTPPPSSQSNIPPQFQKGH